MFVTGCNEPPTTVLKGNNEFMDPAYVILSLYTAQHHRCNRGKDILKPKSPAIFGFAVFSLLLKTDVITRSPSRWCRDVL